MKVNNVYLLYVGRPTDVHIPMHIIHQSNVIILMMVRCCINKSQIIDKHLHISDMYSNSICFLLLSI